MRPVHHLLVGDDRHGVTRLARTLLPPHPAIIRRPAGDGWADDLPSADEAPFVHAHLTDGLLGADPVRQFARFADGRCVAVTLHDVPQPLEGAARFARRQTIYRAIAARADLVIVCSHHERRCLEDGGGLTGPVAVVDHPIDAQPAAGPPSLEGTVGVLGWLYPGKGHDRVLDAMAQVLPGGTLLSIGAHSPGHEYLGDALERHADSLGLTFEITGYLPGSELRSLAAAVAVPVCAHRHVSASGTFGAWMSAGRRPIAPDLPYARELVARCPGALVIAPSLEEAIRRAAGDPASTLLEATEHIGPTTPQAALAQAALLGAWAGTP